MTTQTPFDLSLCENHVGQTHPPRCADCDLEAIEAAAEQTETRLKKQMPGAGTTEAEHLRARARISAESRNQA